jgi:nicotinamidase-related amidase
MSQPGSPRPAPASAPHPMVLARDKTALVVIDVQERLFPAMDSDHREEVMRNIKVLAAAARRLRLPTLATEQYPKGLGHTLQEVKEALPAGVEPIEKVAFSCWGVEGVRARLAATGARQLLLAGIEAHVCVLMSALDLLAEGYGVHVVADAVTSRTQANWRLAMAQLRQAGAVVTTTETVLFQLLGQADTDDFRELARLIR